ncbi:hypothetical protein DHB74_02660 [Pseudomonas sp. G11-1]|nr:hypothetical protein [Pseudomonas sp. G11-1]MCO5788644.1 hypothetical protein [Pseudomonas sp. G11-2]
MNVNYHNKFPTGWFGVLFSDEIACEEVKAIKYFNKDYVVFRGKSGEVSILDAHCPHLGAHLGGGTCEGETIKCPFHGWAFDMSGKCVDIPYCDRIPVKAKKGELKKYPVRELNQVIHMWFDPNGNEPTWEIPEGEGMNGQSGWTKWYFKRWRIKTQGKEIIENLVDGPHFAHVHHAPINTIEVSFDGHIAQQITTIKAHPSLTNDGSELKTDAVYYGPAVMHVNMLGKHKSVQINYHTPIDHEYVDLCYGLKLFRDPSLPDTGEIARDYAEAAHTSFAEDVIIWENKIYRDNPLLCEDDGEIFQLRQWYSQFF